MSKKNIDKLKQNVENLCSPELTQEQMDKAREDIRLYEKDQHVGKKVVVFDVHGKFLDKGEIIDYPLFGAFGTPLMRLDNGREIRGCESWWYEQGERTEEEEQQLITEGLF